MDEHSNSVKRSWLGRLTHWFCRASALKRVCISAAGLVVLTLLAYQEENWRGRHAWLKCQQAAAARGLVTNWNAFFPPRVPEDSNFFAAPKMQEWFVGRGSTGLSGRLGYQSFLRQQSNMVVAEMTVVTPETVVAPGTADLVLRFDDPLLTISTGPEITPTNAEPIIPLIVMDEVPLTDAIKNLAVQANIKYAIDPKINYGQADANGNIPPQPSVSLRWTNLTAADALKAILQNYNLVMLWDSKLGIGRITIKPDKPVIGRELSTQLDQLISQAIAPATNTDAGAHLEAALGFELSTKPLGHAKAAKIVVRSQNVIYSSQVKEFFPKHPMGTKLPLSPETQARSTGSNTYEIYLNPTRVVAADYLAWSDQFEEDFDLIREALKRPYARMEGDYGEPGQSPIPNFLTVRMVAQHLTQRAQAHFLLGQPEKALDDLTLVRGICRALEGRPTQRPMTLISAMIDAAVTGLYAQVIGDGFQLHAWRESELVVLEEQLKEIDLPPLRAAGMDCYRVSVCHALENLTQENYDRVLGNYVLPSSSTPSPDDWFKKLKDPNFRLLVFAPRGWVYQNMATIARIQAEGLDGANLTNDLMRPQLAEDAAEKVHRQFEHATPFDILAAVLLPNFVNGARYVARDQTMVNEARIACALERHRLACGKYPETLDALVPRFIDKLPVDVIGGKPLKYRREGNGFKLYSVGWNERDDGGVSVMKADGTGDLTKADWVWPYGELAAN